MTTLTKSSLAPLQKKNGGKRKPAPRKQLHGSDKFDPIKSSIVITSCKQLVSCMALAEHKETVPTFRGTDAPYQLTPPPLGYRYTETKESAVLLANMRSLFGDKHYRFRLSTVLNMSSSGAGIVNSTISNGVLTSQADFVSLSTVFSEYFVVKFEVKWQPVSRYNYPLGGTSTLSISSLPIGTADLQHDQPVYSSLAAMSDNFRIGYHNTGDPFAYSWINTESPTESVLTTTTGKTQSWNLCSNSANYLGAIQVTSQSSPPALPFSQVLGTFMVHFDVIMRVRS